MADIPQPAARMPPSSSSIACFLSVPVYSTKYQTYAIQMMKKRMGNIHIPHEVASLCRSKVCIADTSMKLVWQGEIAPYFTSAHISGHHAFTHAFPTE
jgi:hypothetical protein